MVLPKKKLLIAGASMMVLTISATTTYAVSLNKQPDAATLFKQLTLAAQAELAHGQVASTAHGTQLVGASADNMAAQHTAVQSQIDALQARSADQRNGAVQSIRNVAGDQALEVRYLQTAPSPYSSQVKSELYYAGVNQYDVNSADNAIIQFGPRPLAPGEAPIDLILSPAKTTTELEQLSRNVITKNTQIDLGQLTPNFSNKNNEVFFYRWEDKSRQLEGDLYPFIQVGITKGGQVVSYTNAVNL